MPTRNSAYFAHEDGKEPRTRFSLNRAEVNMILLSLEDAHDALVLNGTRRSQLTALRNLILRFRGRMS